MKATIHTDFDEFREHGGPGSIILMDNDRYGMMGIGIKCAGCGSESYLPTPSTPVQFVVPHWSWDGNREAPTLTPSVFHTKERGGCGWHGFLRNGEWVSC